MKHLIIKIALMSVILAGWSGEASARENVEYEASLTAGGGSGVFAPYYISSMRGGRVSQRYTIQAEGLLRKTMDNDRKFSYGFGVDLLAGYSSTVDYERWNEADKVWFSHAERPSAAWIQQLYGEVKWRSLFLSAGAKERGSYLLDNDLTSGDLVESGNARPIPQVRVGFVDFQDIPLTNGWVQVQGEVGYGYMVDNSWWEDHYNYYNYHIARNTLYNYKRMYFRTNPSKRFSVTVGMQAAALFGGEEQFYYKGKPTYREKHSSDLKTFLKVIIPHQDGGEAFYTGNHLGSWDLRARYTLSGGQKLYAYFSWPWEDGSGIGKLNGWDGLWGLEYKNCADGLLTGAVIEYLDFTNQSGPIHFSPGDFEGTTIPDHASGSDDYYNNRAYNSYAYYGMSIGTPALMAPIYNTGGYMAYRANAMRGFHVGLTGTLIPGLRYRVKGGYRKAWGNGYQMLPEPIHLTAVMIEADWAVKGVSGLSVKGQLELDRGDMPCNNFGAVLTVRYNGSFNY